MFYAGRGAEDLQRQHVVALPTNASEGERLEL
jgi:hypothetical protein